MKLLVWPLFLILIFGCKQKTERPVRQDKLLVINDKVEEEGSTTLFFPDYGIYFDNWPEHWVMSNHGKGCAAQNNYAGFIFGTPSTMVGTFELYKTDDFTFDYFSSFDVKEREVIWNKNIDLELSAVDGGKVGIKFFNLDHKYEKWVLENVSMLPAVDDNTVIKEVEIPYFPIYIPRKRQRISLILGFDVLRRESNIFEVTFKNETTGLGTSCSLATNVNGKVTTSLGASNVPFSIGDKISIEAKEEKTSWHIIRKRDMISVIEHKDGQKNGLYDIPISKNYEWSFYARED
ncbi:hypothetical protein KIM67_11545 [Flagellimonas sp. 389]|uniref:hypothetical protein n=1 Tax=Flagellimonas sp. 389 TaxID=2835862 RepID=UPI001BD1E4F0|nr:hypothetical protein [Flagellimonas sp. 389]MBS9463047.1 hypothetical protein [Flagellimonas sp. 389]